MKFGGNSRLNIKLQRIIGLGEEGILSSMVEGMGEGSVSGESRGRIVKCLGNIRAQVLEKAMENVRPQSTRAVRRQRDKVSCAWLPALPGVNPNLTHLSSPACADRVGEVIRGRVCVDKYGDNFQSSPLPGDHRTRHDRIKHLQYRLCVWAGLPVEMEVFNLFSGLGVAGFRWPGRGRHSSLT